MPKFTLAFAQASLAIGGEGIAAGNYEGLLTGLSSAPAVLGQPLRMSASRSGATVGPTDIDFHALVDHIGAVSRDSVQLSVAGIQLPSVTVPGLGATMDLGIGDSHVEFQRMGNEIAGSLRWEARNADWQRLASQSTGLQARVENLVWRTVSAVQNVSLEVRFSGNALGPSLAIRSNIGSAIAQSLRQQLSAEIDSAAAVVRAEVDRIVGEPVRDARSRVAALETEVRDVVANQKAAIEQIREQLDARIRELTRLVPGGIGG